MFSLQTENWELCKFVSCFSIINLEVPYSNFFLKKKEWISYCPQKLLTSQGCIIILTCHYEKFKVNVEKCVIYGHIQGQCQKKCLMHVPLITFQSRSIGDFYFKQILFVTWGVMTLIKCLLDILKVTDKKGLKHVQTVMFN